MATGNDTDRLLTVPEVTARWQVHDRTASRLIKAGRLPHVRIGRQIRLRLAGIQSFERNSDGTGR